MSLVGLLTATEKQFPPGCRHMRPIQWHLKNNAKVPESLEKVLPIPRSLHPHLRWWLQEDNVLQGQPLHPLKHAVQICKSGFLAPQKVLRFLLEQHSSHSYRQHHSGCLHKQVGLMKLGPRCTLLWRILTWCSGKQVTQSRTHSRLAECGSRQAIQARPEHPEWSLLPEVFQSICSTWHRPQIDLFATWFNNKLPLVCVTSTRPPGLGSGCNQPALGGPGCVCLPTGSHLGQRSMRSMLDKTRTSDISQTGLKPLFTSHPAFFPRTSWPRKVQTVWPWPQGGGGSVGISPGNLPAVQALVIQQLSIG